MQRKWKRRWQRLTKNILPPLTAGLLILSSYHPVYAAPTGYTVVSGNAAITTQGATTTINQTSNKAILNWQSFSIAKGETVNFIQPSASSVALNRVVGSDASTIYGTLSANGKVFLINPNGILFAPGSQVCTGGLVASTLNITDSDFLNGKYTFSSTTGNGVTNQGTINAVNEAVLLGPKVANEGVITAKVTGLAAGKQVSLDFSGDQLLNLTVDTGAAGGSATNSGTITSSGGLVVMSAGTKNALLHTVVNNSGVIRAQSVKKENGIIRLEGGTVTNSGTLDASGKASGETGGTIKLLGDTVTVKTGSTIDVSGDRGGGIALIGGAYQGSASEYAATNTTVEQGATVNADAITKGNGGQVVIWANDTTKFAGTISAKGGSASGDGGRVETSGKQTLNITGSRVNTTAANGQTGNWLLDPADFTIGSGMTGTNYWNNSDLGTALASNNITISTGRSANTVIVGTTTTPTDTSTGTGSGDINVNSDLTWSSGKTLTLSAYNNLNLNAAITATSGGLTLAANTIGTGNGTTSGIITPASGSRIDVGTFTLQRGTWREASTSLSSFYAKDFRISGGTFIRTLGGSGTSGNPYQIADVYGLQGIGSSGMLSKYYTLANNIDASGTSAWNSGAGFNPIGVDTTPFTSTFDGFGHTITGLIINRPTDPFTGLFGSSSNSTVIRNVGLTGGSIRGGVYTGGLAGVNKGTITNSYNTGTVSSRQDYDAYTGGLVGLNYGTITNSYNTGTVSSSSVYSIDYAGGLVGNNRGFITNSYNTGTVSSPSHGSCYGGLAGDNYNTITNSYYVITNSYYATTDAAGNTINSGSGYNTYGEGKTLTQLKQASTFRAWGSDISATGGGSAVWRIYDGYTTPLLRSFLTPVTVTGATKTYDGQISGTASSYTLDTAATLSGSLACTTASKNAGTYSTAGNTLTLNGLYSGQQGYDISYTLATLTITPASLTVSNLTATSKVYDGNTTATVSGTLTGILGSDAVTLGGGSFTNKNAGTGKTVTVSNLSGTDAVNYTLQTATTSANITQAALTVTANNTNNAYNGQPYSGGSGVSYTGFVNGEGRSVLGGVLTYGGTAQGALTPGTYTLTVSGFTSPNYTITYQPGTLTILGRMTDPAYDSAVIHAEHTAAAFSGFSGRTYPLPAYAGPRSGYRDGSTGTYAPLTILGTGLNTNGYTPLTGLVTDDRSNAEPIKGGTNP